MLEKLLYGFAVLGAPVNVAFLVGGCLVGTLVGLLPGIGPVGTLALVLPMMYGVPPTAAMIFLAGVYYGAMYGGSTTAILLNIPGESASVVTALDGYKMARDGRAGPALAIAAVGSFVAGTLSVVLLMTLAPLVTDWALRFGPVEYFALMVFALCAVAGLSAGSSVRGLLSLVFGLMLSTIGMDPITGYLRFTAGSLWLAEGVDFAVAAVGLFAVSEVLIAVRDASLGRFEAVPVGRVWLSLKELAESFWSILRGSGVGFLVGVLPGAGATIASFLAYSLEKRVARNSESIGTGDIRGVAAPESANNAASVGSMVPMLTLGVPGSAATAMMLAALMMVGVTPGPSMIEKHPDVFWGLIASMYVGNLILLLLNFPLVPLLVRVLTIPPGLLLPLVLVVSVVGVWGIRYSPVDVGMLGVLGAVGYYLREHQYPLAPILLGLVLGRRLEQSMRQALIISQGDPAIFLSSPLSAGLVALALFVILFPSLKATCGRVRRYIARTSHA